MSDAPKYALSDEQINQLKNNIAKRQPTRRPTLVSIVDYIRNEIETARKNNVSWDDIAEEFNNIMPNNDNKVTGNTLSQAYVTVKKRINESRKDNKISYEELEQRCLQLENELTLLKSNQSTTDSAAS